MIKWLLVSVGAACVLAGMLTFWLPLPIGIPLMLIGLALMMKNSPKVRIAILRVSRGYPKLRKILRQLSVKTDKA